MSEAIAFISGITAMSIVWFVTDYLTHDGAYRRGYRDALRDISEADMRGEEQCS